MNDRPAELPDQHSLAGKRAVVTGAASGIGSATARRLAAAGATVIVVDREAEAVERIAADLDAEARVVDLEDPDAAAPLGEHADIVVNNAGLQHVAPVHQFPPEMFAKLVKVMLESPFRLIRAALPGMYERGWGRIVNISSVHGLRASPFKSAYVSAKHGLEGLSKTVAVEAAGYGVTSNCVCPGFVRTPLVERQVAEQAELHRVPEEQVVEDVLLARTPVKRLVEPDEVADLVHWLCGPSTASITGASFPMDGGWTAH
ncbi:MULTISPECIES: 3-hydroxybutyrate dehydrogenase [Saccharopolyspora]|uniref:3-hydroxybutyrate dehydrogenase n=1 Tax=Saccharopolyspora gregorii TaxID=33914 RepID=A0ABP6RY64_9PSEU|nr:MULTISPECIES: 3-hydroxybutyrate dehydrogenase [Saccharopolyspora]MCA1190164.1 3-hydroxybutyrate dehydrogenase [Saccharopolyspora sp. 6T]MCA1194554.1 3-hydroxybutyrate dehydrogenase [Saccharopolyspora sp. 6V]MCA1226739.1 3-hydroxybutyrate dehydrogenase [Saccharopolyspora sp. 6M]MCA1281630.1 3-hydroxybutyrate dehydrogenase [Saccharopolyspora sp. 7B]